MNGRTPAWEWARIGAHQRTNDGHRPQTGRFQAACSTVCTISDNTSTHETGNSAPCFSVSHLAPRANDAPISDTTAHHAQSFPSYTQPTTYFSYLSSSGGSSRRTPIHELGRLRPRLLMWSRTTGAGDRNSTKMESYQFVVETAGLASLSCWQGGLRGKRLAVDRSGAPRSQRRRTGGTMVGAEWIRPCPFNPSDHAIANIIEGTKSIGHS